MNRQEKTVLPEVACVLAMGAALFLLSCKGEVQSSPAPQVPEIGVLTVTPTSVPDEPEFIGQAEASRIVEIRSQVTGIIQERYFQEGREIKKGDRLYRIDEVPFRAAVASATGRVSQSQARVVQAKQNLARVKPLLAEHAMRWRKNCQPRPPWTRPREI